MGSKMRWLFVITICFAVSACDQSNDNTKIVQNSNIIQDCDVCPEMVVIPAGAFEMGARINDPKALKKRELPAKSIEIRDRFALGKYEITRSQYMVCVGAGACRYSPPTMPWEQNLTGKNDFPVMMVTWSDAQAYVHWLTGLTGHRYSLPSEAEWEYSARGDTSSIYWWGDSLVEDMAHCVGCGGGHPLTGDHKAPLRVGSYPPNPFGLHDMTGNVSEIVQDCYSSSIADIPSNGDPITKPECDYYSLRGSSFRGLASSRQTRLSSRQSTWKDRRHNFIGFRVKRELGGEDNVR